jgi:hypothetical protein
LYLGNLQRLFTIGGDTQGIVAGQQVAENFNIGRLIIDDEDSGFNVAG